MFRNGGFGGAAVGLAPRKSGLAGANYSAWAATVARLDSGVTQQVVRIEQAIGNFRSSLQCSSDCGRYRLASLAAKARYFIQLYAETSHATYFTRAR